MWFEVGKARGVNIYPRYYPFTNKPLIIGETDRFLGSFIWIFLFPLLRLIKTPVPCLKACPPFLISLGGRSGSGGWIKKVELRSLSILHWLCCGENSKRRLSSQVEVQTLLTGLSVLRYLPAYTDLPSLWVSCWNVGVVFTTGSVFTTGILISVAELSQLPGTS